ncbi:MAG: hypothetical protein ABIY40_01915 [Rhodanobacteraceae bacterium]
MTAMTNDASTLTVPEVLLMLRAPGAGWLATLLAALDEAQRDPDFDPRQRAAFAQIAAEHGLPCAVAEASRRRAMAFESQLQQATNDAPRQADVA